jgi:hypothetical protein
LLAGLMAGRQPAGSTAPTLTGPAAPTPREPTALRRLNLGIGIVLVMLVVLLQPVLRPSATIAGPDGLLVDAPVGLATGLRIAGSPADRAVVPQSWASWFEWATPGVPVMVDSRIEVEPASAWAEYLLIAAGGSGAIDALARSRATLVVVDRHDQGVLLRTLQAPESGWRLVDQESDGAIFRVASTGMASSRR